MPLNKSGPGSCAICGTRSTLTAGQVAKFNKQLMTEPVTVVAARWHVGASAARRHKINHALRPVVTDVMLSEDRSGFDTVDTLIGAFDDADLIRRQALAAGKPEVALRAMTAQQRLAKQLWADLGIDVSAERLRAHELTALLDAIRDATREHPMVAKAIAQHTDGSVRDALSDLYTRYAATEKETAA